MSYSTAGLIFEIPVGRRIEIQQVQSDLLVKMMYNMVTSTFPGAELDATQQVCIYMPQHVYCDN